MAVGVAFVQVTGFQRAQNAFGGRGGLKIHVHLVQGADKATILSRFQLISDSVPHVGAVFCRAFPYEQEVIFEINHIGTDVVGDVAGVRDRTPVFG